MKIHRKQHRKLFHGGVLSLSKEYTNILAIHLFCWSFWHNYLKPKTSAPASTALFTSEFSLFSLSNSQLLLPHDFCCLMCLALFSLTKQKCFTSIKVISLLFSPFLSSQLHIITLNTNTFFLFLHLSKACISRLLHYFLLTVPMDSWVITGW